MAKINITGDNTQLFINEKGNQTNNFGIPFDKLKDFINIIKAENYDIDKSTIKDLEAEINKPKANQSKLKELFKKIATELTTKVTVELLKPEIVTLIEKLQTSF